MDFETWNPYYRKICSDLEIKPETDYESSILLNDILQKRNHAAVQKEITEPVWIVGNGPDLEDILTDLSMNGIVFVADSAIGKYMKVKGYPDYVFTDLDGPIKLIRECSENSVSLVVHAHGDNKEMIERHVPLLNVHTGTTQNRPLGVLRNFGGFTDGDRAAFFADFFNAPEIIMVGFDFSVPSIKEGSDYHRKMKKLRWAESLLSVLAQKRGSQFRSGQIIRI